MVEQFNRSLLQRLRSYVAHQSDFYPWSCSLTEWQLTSSTGIHADAWTVSILTDLPTLHCVQHSNLHRQLAVQTFRVTRSC